MGFFFFFVLFSVDPQFLVSEDDIVEVEPDELERTTRTFPPVPHPHTSASQPKDVIFVERKGTHPKFDYTLQSPRALSVSAGCSD